MSTCDRQLCLSLTAICVFADRFHVQTAYRDLIEMYAAPYNIHPALVASIIRNKSSFRAEAESAVGGARGLMQLTPELAEWIAKQAHFGDYSFDSIFDPETNINLGCWYLGYLSYLFDGDIVSIVAAYHAGQGQVKQWLADPSMTDDGKTLSAEKLPDGPTKSYVERVIRDFEIYKEIYFNDVNPG